MTYDLIIVGAGGLGREVLQYALDTFAGQQAFRVKGFLDDNPEELSDRGYALDVGIIGSTQNYEVKDNDRFLLAVGDPNVRKRLVERLSARAAKFTSLVHPQAYVAPSAILGVGCIISPFATVATFTRLEDHVVLGFYAHVGHDSTVGKYNVLSPYAAVNGGVDLAESVFLGTHAVVTPGHKVGKAAQIAAGSVVYSDIPANRLAVGNPAKIGPRLSIHPSSIITKDRKV